MLINDYLLFFSVLFGFIFIQSIIIFYIVVI